MFTFRWWRCISFWLVIHVSIVKTTSFSCFSHTPTCGGWSPGLLIVSRSTCLQILLASWAFLFPFHIWCILTGSVRHSRSLRLHTHIMGILRCGIDEGIGLTSNGPFLNLLAVIFVSVSWCYCTAWCLCRVAGFWWCDVAVLNICRFSTPSPWLDDDDDN